METAAHDKSRHQLLHILDEPDSQQKAPENDFRIPGTVFPRYQTVPGSGAVRVLVDPPVTGVDHLNESFVHFSSNDCASSNDEPFGGQTVKGNRTPPPHSF